MSKPPAATAASPKQLPNPDALPPGGGSYMRQPDGTLVPANPPATAPNTLATPE